MTIDRGAQSRATRIARGQASISAPDTTSRASVSRGHSTLSAGLVTSSRSMRDTNDERRRRNSATCSALLLASAAVAMIACGGADSTGKPCLAMASWAAQWQVASTNSTGISRPTSHAPPYMFERRRSHQCCLQ